VKNHRKRSAKQEISIAAQSGLLELTVTGVNVNVDLRWANPISRLSMAVFLRNLGRVAAVALLASICAFPSKAQTTPVDEEVKPIPLFTGSAGFVSNFQGGQPDLHPLLTPLLLVPIGQHWVFETRATFETDLVQVPGRSGYHGGPVQKEVEYAQIDYIGNPYMTVTVGRFLTPFGIFNERLYPIWIRNLQSDPLILPIGIGPSNASLGAMVRGGFKAHPKFNINYAAYFSTLSTTTPVNSDRFAGMRAGIFVPAVRLEIGGSFQHGLQDARSNAFGFHGIWQPPSLPLDLRTEYARSIAGSGYWAEAAYRLGQISWHQNQFRRTQLVARVQQYFVGSNAAAALQSVNIQAFEFGLNYYFIDGLKLASNYGRQFSSAGNRNIWTMALTYRFVVPLGPTGSQ